ncbi:peptidase S24/S26A/S26B/S26C [Mycena maculata]|uniref:Peptidase S24/S26A/S26B/S26C n=1 Tax=Mycena maculata TaxID=230809 RepID=A0AAD7KF59_9AGAR|nr:peptidase S24/S26A/S26B/S26C [Mycena maculata]
MHDQPPSQIIWLENSPCKTLYYFQGCSTTSPQVVNFLGAVHMTMTYVGTISTMSGPSMLPTLANEGEVVVENRWSIRFNPSSIQRGDLLTLRSPLDRTRVICKRVIGFPGDVICVDPTGLKAPSTEHVVVPKGHIWITGDNAAYSRDSRDYGPVSMGLIQGRLYARILPLSKFTIFRNPTTYLDY